MVYANTRRNTYDLRDPEKGWGVEVLVFRENAKCVYECREPGNPARELLRIVIPQRIQPDGVNRHDK